LTSSCPPKVDDFQTSPLSPSDRIRLIHDYVTSSTSQGGLGITPGNSQYPHIKSVFCLHDHTFNKAWIDRWTRRQLGINISDQELDIIRHQFGESVALYYSFLATYTKALLFPTFLGITFWKFGAPYHPLYSALVVLWSIGMVEWWRIRERKLAVRWGSRGAFRVEKRRVEFDVVIGKRGSTTSGDDGDDNEAFPWWKREIRILTSLPVIILAALALTGLLTGLFIIEAFVTQLYTGLGHQVASLFPTILFAALVPQFMALYQKIAARLSEPSSRYWTYDALTPL
jgi:anoctamin-10